MVDQIIPCYFCRRQSKKDIKNPTNAILKKSEYIFRKSFSDRPKSHRVTTYSCGVGYDDCSILIAYRTIEEVRKEPNTLTPIG